MIQVSKFLPPNYETVYNRIDGPTGPCVYPAIHLYIHSALYYITDHGKDIRLAQIIYAILYLSTLALVLASYRRANAPPWLLVPLVLSKRLHSIFLLRLFNDCWAAFYFWLAIYGATRRWFWLTVIAWSIALGVKMTMLLPLPAIAVILVQGSGTEMATFYGFLSWIIQFGSAIPFMGREETFIYLKQAFNLGRQFLYKWTVNWRFISEDVFLSKWFAYLLLVLHATVLLAFLHYKWVRPSSSGLPDFLKKCWNYIDIKDEDLEKYLRRMTPTFVMDALLGSIAIGMLYARSLHYQFYAYLGWATPYLLWRSGTHPVIVLVLCALQELAWLVYPSTVWSSATVVGLLILQVGSISNARFFDTTAPTLTQRKKQQ